MKDAEPSRTAEYMALFRALESARSPEKRLFVDPFARAFVGRWLNAVVTLAHAPGGVHLVHRFIDHRWPGARSSAVARTRFIDDRVCAAVANGIEQLVLLGAGFDSRAYRLPGIDRVAVFEVDHPSTLDKKRRVIGATLGAVPSHVRFVATDFNQGTLRGAMAAAGYGELRRTLFVWEGVTNYITESAVDETL